MNIESVKASDLRTGDRLPSGFVVTHNAWRGVRTPANKVEIEGRYAGEVVPVRRQWNRNTIVQVIR